MVAVLVAALIGLGIWQLQRWDEVAAENDRIDTRIAAAPVPLEELAADATPDQLEYRRVTVTGRYRPDEEVLQRSRAHRGQNGWHVLTPLVTGPDRAVLVRRGWVPYDLDEPPVGPAAPPDDEVEVTGFLQRSDEQPGFGPSDPRTGRLERVFHADVGRLQRQVDAELWPMVLQLQSQSPPQGELPIPAPAPELDETRHWSYALQWFGFAVVLAVGYGVVIRRRLHDDDASTEPSAPTLGSTEHARRL